MLLASLLLAPILAFSSDTDLVRMSLVSGDVQIETEGTGDWVPAAVNTPLRAGDRVWVPANGRAEIQVPGGVFVRLDASTSFDILSLGGESLQFAVNSGRAYINNRQYGIDHVQVDTPLGSIDSYDDSLVMIAVGESGATELSVLSGYGYAETNDGKIRVEADSTLRIGADLRAEILTLGPSDAWEEWNRERDEQLAEDREGLRYLPEELNDYASDLDDNGRWLYASDYGYVWSPWESASMDWSPYRIGRWVWSGGQYVWISHEPWGWAPYHYGRWAYFGTVGWCWVPPRHGSVFWAPGYVGWVHTPTYVSWVPLAPGDIYYGYGHFGPGSVNISIGKTVVKRQFRNVHVRNAVTVLHRDTFVHGRKADFRAAQNPFTLNDVSAGPPVFKPHADTRLPVIRKVAPAHQPPARVRGINPDHLRRERRLVTDESGSVFRPGRPLREMPAIRREAPALPARKQGPERFGEIRQVPMGDEMQRRDLPVQQRVPVRRPETSHELERAGRGGTTVVAPTLPRVIAPVPAVRPSGGPTQRSVRPSRPDAQRDSGSQMGSTPAYEKPKLERKQQRIERQAIPARSPETLRQPQSSPQMRAPEGRRERTPKPGLPATVPAVSPQAAQPPVQPTSRVERPQGSQEKVRQETQPSSRRHRGSFDVAPTFPQQEEKGLERR
jgi:hypothetical protein